MAYFFDSEEKGKTAVRFKASADLDISPGKKDFESFCARLHQEILRSQRRNYSLSLMRVEVDLNGTLKDRATALVLADILKSSIREYDVLCSLRPDEFVIAFPETGERNAELIAGRIRRNLEQQLWDDAVTEAFSANVGIACFPQDGTNAEDLLDSAEHDLHIAQKRR